VLVSKSARPTRIELESGGTDMRPPGVLPVGSWRAPAAASDGVSDRRAQVSWAVTCALQIGPESDVLVVVIGLDPHRRGVTATAALRPAAT
jgi:hypothetical protein